MWRHASSSASRDLLLAEVLLEHAVVGLGGRLEQLVPPPGHLVGQLGRDRDLDLLAALELPGLAVDEVDVAAEGLRGADREVERRDLVAERLAQRIERRARIRVLAVALVEHEAGGRAVARPVATAASSPASTPPDASITNSAASAAWKPSIISADEVRVAGRVHDA